MIAVVGPEAIPHLQGLIDACRAGRAEDYDGADVDWAADLIARLAVAPEECSHPRDYRTGNEDGTQSCACGAIVATDGKSIYIPTLEAGWQQVR